MRRYLKQKQKRKKEEWGIKVAKTFITSPRTIRESMDGRLPPIDDPDIKTYSYALYNCEYCNTKIFLSLETKATFNTPYTSRPGVS